LFRITAMQEETRRFTDEEAAAVLRATMAPAPVRMGAQAAAARRWIPWLGTSTAPSMPVTATSDSRPHVQATATDFTPRLRMLASVIGRLTSDFRKGCRC
jgi:hypothetical protein